MSRFAIVMACLSLVGAAFAADPPGAPATSGDRGARPAPVGGRPGYLDFEADVIEGKKKAPDLFLQSESQKITPDALIYMRGNFNDFHAIDRTRRPKLSQ